MEFNRTYSIIKLKENYFVWYFLVDMCIITFIDQEKIVGMKRKDIYERNLVLKPGKEYFGRNGI